MWPTTKAASRRCRRPSTVESGSLRSILAAGVLALLLLGGCVGDEPAVPPTELTPIDAEVTLSRRWGSSVEEAGRGRFRPLLEGELLVVASGNGEVIAFDRRSGARRWRTELDTALASGVGGGEDALYVGSSDGVVHALEARTGEPLWSAPMSSEILVAPVAAFGTVVVRSVDGRIAALEPDSGEERWSVSNTPPALTVTGYGRPLLLDGGVLIGLDDGRALALTLEGGRTIWETVLSVPSGRSEIERLVDADADPLVDREGIYMVNHQGRAARLEPARGGVVWSVPMSSTAGLALGGDRLVVVDEEDVLHALERESGRELWTSEALRGRRLSPPAVLVDAGVALVGDLEGYLHAVSLEDGVLVGRTRAAKEPITARPLVDDATVYVQSESGRVSAHGVAR